MPDTQLFRDDGYQTCGQVLDRPAVEEVRAFLASHVERQVAAACAEIGCASQQEVVAHIGKVFTGEAPAAERLSKATRDTLSGHFSLEARLSMVLWEVPRQKALQELLRDALRSRRLYMHMPPTARFVLPGNVYAGVPAHQDISYNRHMSDFVTVWVPLVDIDDECGGVKVYRGSGAALERLSGEEREKFWLKGVSADGYESEHCKIAVGDVLLLNKWILHESMPNRSGRTRLSIDFRFFGEGSASGKHYLDMQSWTVIAPGETVQ